MNGALHRAWRRVLRRVGYAWVLALLLLALSVVIALWTPRLKQRADLLRADVAAQSDLVSRLGKPAPRPLSSGEPDLAQSRPRVPDRTDSGAPGRSASRGRR